MTMLMRAMRRRSFLFVAAAAMVPFGRVTPALADDPAPAKVTVDNFSSCLAACFSNSGMTTLGIISDSVRFSK